MFTVIFTWVNAQRVQATYPEVTDCTQRPISRRRIYLYFYFVFVYTLVSEIHLRVSKVCDYTLEFKAKNIINSLVNDVLSF